MLRELREAAAELEEQPNRSPATSARLGVCLYLLGRYSDAVETLSHSDGGALTHFYLGKAYLALDKYAEALTAWYAGGSTALLDAYSSTCLRRVWRAEHFSWWMTSMLHRAPDADRFDLQLQLSQLRYLASSRAAATSLAENYVGLERV
jgi:tetratricopeptide (TPR) repeat protein